MLFVFIPACSFFVFGFGRQSSARPFAVRFCFIMRYSYNWMFIGLDKARKSDSTIPRPFLFRSPEQRLRAFPHTGRSFLNINVTIHTGTNELIAFFPFPTFIRPVFWLVISSGFYKLTVFAASYFVFADLIGWQIDRMFRLFFRCSVIVAHDEIAGRDGYHFSKTIISADCRCLVALLNTSCGGASVAAGGAAWIVSAMARIPANKSK